LSFLQNNCTFKVLNEDTLNSCDSFDCDHTDLNDFFLNDCVNYSKELLGKSYCFSLDSDNKTIVCAFTISNDSIKVNHLPGSRKRKINNSISRVKHSKSYPAVLIGRLGVNKDFKGKGIGQELMDFIKSWFIDIGNKTGCRFIVVDAYNESTPLKYYTKNGFDFIFSSDEQEKEANNYAVDYPLSTKLMYFDLIRLSST
jgi:GNAT superfamily N-acetyltransferase